MSFLAFPVFRYIDIDDSEQIIQAIHLTGSGVPIDLVLHTPGGLVLASLQIARALARLLPLPVIEICHFMGSLIGVGLLLLARALQQRVDAAYFLASALLGTGALASLLKGFDYEEAAILALMLAALLPCRRCFYR